MHKHIVQISLLTLVICSNGAFAGIKEKLIELSKATQPTIINDIIKDIVTSENLESITTIPLDLHYFEGIFTAMTKGEINNDSALLFLKILNQSHLAPRKAVELIGSYIRNIDALSDEVKKSLMDNKTFLASFILLLKYLVNP